MTARGRCDKVPHNVLGQVIDKLPVVKSSVLVQVVLKHRCDLAGAHHWGTLPHSKLACLGGVGGECKRESESDKYHSFYFHMVSVKDTS